jgi:2-oxoglutarate ferredoxin oxidoreductase subunit gamma
MERRERGGMETKMNTKINTERLMFSGFGGQGVMLMGELIAQAAMIEGKEVSWLPSYGPEMRGGTANCGVTIADEVISSPIIRNPTTLVAMNGPSMEKFEATITSGGTMFVNDSLIRQAPAREDITVVHVDSVGIAEAMGDSRLANMVMLGALIRRSGLVSMDAVEQAMIRKFTGQKAKFIPQNREALVAWKATT